MMRNGGNLELMHWTPKNGKIPLLHAKEVEVTPDEKKRMKRGEYVK